MPSPLPRAPILGAPLSPRARAWCQIRAGRVEQGVREGAEQPRSAAMEESRSHLGRDSTSRGFVYRRQTFVL